MIKRLTAAICLMARKEDKDLLDSIDAVIDAMNVETPNWRTELYNEYYGSPPRIMILPPKSRNIRQRSRATARSSVR